MRIKPKTLFSVLCWESDCIFLWQIYFTTVCKVYRALSKKNISEYFEKNTLRIITKLSFTVNTVSHALTSVLSIVHGLLLGFFFTSRVWSPFVHSRPARTHVQLSDQSRPVPAQWERPVQWATISIWLHLSAPAGGAIPHVPLRRSVHAVEQPDGHREHLRAGSTSSLQRCRVGQEHPILSRPTAHGSGKATRDQWTLVIMIK